MIVLHLSRSRATPSKQQGVVLFIALIVLVVMSLVGISMIRQGSSSQMIVGNLAFKEGAEAASDFGVELARSCLIATSGSDLEKTDSTWIGSADPCWYAKTTGFYIPNGLKPEFKPFERSWVDVLPKDTSDQNDPVNVLKGVGYSVSYVIHRLCDEAGSVTATNNLCILYSETSSKEGVDYGNAPVAGFMPYYRVTVRVTGPRNTRSYVQALLY